MALDWFQQPPAMVPTAPSLGAQHAPFYSAGIAIIPAADRWGVQQPAPVRPKVFPRGQMQSYARPDSITLTTPDIAKQGWQTVMPAWIARRRTFHQGFYSRSHFATEPPPAPMPGAVYPSWLPAKVAARFSQLTFAPSPEQSIATPWLSVYPAFVRRNTLPVALMPSTWLGSFGTISVPDTSWIAHYPDRHVYAQLRWFNIEVNVDPISTPAAPDLSWQPSFADFASTYVPMHVSHMPSSWWDVITPPRTPYEWQMQHRDPIRRVSQPVPYLAVGYDLPTVWPVMASVCAPDYIIRKGTIPQSSIFDTPQSAQPAMARFRWQMQTALPKRTIQLGWFYIPTIIVPSLIADVYDCIELKDSDVYYSTMQDITVMESTIIDESLTPISPNESFC